MIRIQLLFALVFLCSSINMNGQSVDSTAYELFERAWFDKGKPSYTLAKADSMLRVAINIFTKEGNIEMVFRSRIRLAWIEKSQGDTEAAIKSLETIIAESNTLEGEKYGIQGEAYFYLGKIYYSKQDVKKALEQHEKSVELSSKEPGNETRIIDAHIEIGNLYGEMAQVDKFLMHLQEALRISNELEKNGIKYKQKSRIYGDLGYAYVLFANYGKALQYMQKAQALTVKEKGETSRDVAALYSNMSNAYHSMGDFEKALETMEKCMDILTNHHSKSLNYLCQGYANIGLAYRSVNQKEKAIESFHKALKIETELYGENPVQSAFTLINTGLTYRDLNDFDKAIEYGLKGQDGLLRYFGPRHPYTGMNLVSLAIAEAEKENFDKALEYCRSGFNALIVDLQRDSVTEQVNLDLTKTTDDSEEYLRAFYVQAQILTKRYQARGDLQDLKDAYQSYSICDQIIDKARQSKISTTLASYNGLVGVIVYPEAVRNAYDLYEKTKEYKYLEQAFYLAEKGKANLLLQSSAESLARQFSNVPKELFEEEQKLKESIASLEGSLVNAVARSDRESIRKIRDEDIFKKGLELEVLIKSIEKNYPAYGEMKYKTVPSTITEVQAALDDNTVLIEYLINSQEYEDKLGDLDPKLFAFVISATEVNKIRIDWPASMAEDITAFHRLSQKTSIVKTKNKKRFIELSNKLYNKLLKPVESQIIGKEHLVVIGDGVLNYIPFELLLKNNEQKEFKDLDYLIKDYEVSYHYSATFYAKQKEKRTFDSEQLLAFAPVFNDGETASVFDTGETRSWPDSMFQSMRDNRFVPLYWSEKEVTAINNLFESKNLKNNTILLHDNANEQNLKQLSKKPFKYIHIASHSFSNLEQPRFSGIACSVDASSEDEDGILYVGEIYNLSLNADLVVLSSCESGIGKLLKGEGMLGINRSFIYAGVPNIIFSLWKVNDEKSSKLMTAFYENMLKGQNYSQALRSAKLKMLNDEVSALPVYWSPFVLIGG